MYVEVGEVKRMKGSFVITAMCTIRFDEGICYVTKDGLKAPAKIKGKKYPSLLFIQKLPLHLQCTIKLIH